MHRGVDLSPWGPCSAVVSWVPRKQPQSMDPTGTNQLHDAFQKKCRYIRTRIALASIAYSSCMVRRRFASEKWEWRVGLRTCMRPLLENCLLAWMECAAPSSYLMTRPWLGC